MDIEKQTQVPKDNQLPSNYRVSIKVLIRGAGGKILLVKEGTDAWGIPGGGLDHGESIEEGLRREVREELGVEVTDMPALPILTQPYFYEEFNRWRLWLLYEVKLAGEPKIGPDSLGIGWFTKHELPDLPIDKTEDEAVRDVFNRFG